MAMSDRGESQGRPTKKRSIQAADDNVDDDVPDATVATPVRSSKKVKTATGSKLNEPQFLHRTGSIPCPFTERKWDIDYSKSRNNCSI